MKTNKNILLYIIFACLLAFDQLTKLGARHFLASGEPFKIIGSFLTFQLSFNTGAAFGIMQNSVPMLLLIGVVAIFIIVRASRHTNGSKLVNIAFSMILAGACGNTIDRLAFMNLGVTDFISFDFGTYVFPTFNIADASLVCGTILLVYAVMVVEKRTGKNE